MDLSIVLCAHNEEGSLGGVLEEIKSLDLGGQIIVVNDGSTDATASIAQKAGADLVSLHPNQGKGKAISAGIEAAQREWVLFIDADGQDPPSDIPRLIEAAGGGADFVNGSKFIGTLESGAISGPNYWGNKFMSWLVNVLFGSRITDSQSGFRLIRSDFLKGLDLKSTEYEIESEILICAIKDGLRIREAPVLRSGRSAGHTDFRRMRNGLRILWTILKARFKS